MEIAGIFADLLILVVIIYLYIRVNKVLSDYCYNKGMALYNLSRYDKALICFNIATGFKPNNNADYWYNKGMALYNLSRYDEALKCFNKAINLKPDDHKVRKALKKLKELNASKASKASLGSL